MSASSSQKHNTKAERLTMAAKNEKIINDLLLQFAYTLTLFVLTIFVFNATAAYKYGQGAYTTTRSLMWVLFGVGLALGILFVFLYKNKGKASYKTTSVYSFITAAVAFWYVGVEKIPYYLQNIIPFFSKFVGTYKAVFAMFPLLGIALVAEFAVYFVRYYSLNSKKK